MTHATRLHHRLRASRAAKLATLWLALAGFMAIFAEVFAAEAPIIAVGPNGVTALAAVTSPAEYAAMSRSEVEARHAGDLVVWPLWRDGPLRRSPLGARLRPSAQHPLGTDAAGRDILALVVHGGRAALAPTVVGLAIATFLGLVLGALAGTRGGMWDELLMRLAELCGAVPTVLVLAVLVAIDPSRTGVALIVAISVVRWAEVARVVRVESLRLAGSDIMLAARALGCSPFAVFRRHFLRAIAAPLAVETALALPALVWLEAAMSFLGLGVPSSWGTIIADAFVRDGSALGAVCAVVLLSLTAGAAALVADAVADAASPRLLSTVSNHTPKVTVR
ncbi:MAG: ABC transporter permease [Myxococcales bacterium]|nr:ABC transporter permease [Myxococcales bacterium]